MLIRVSCRHCHSMNAVRCCQLHIYTCMNVIASLKMAAVDSVTYYLQNGVLWADRWWYSYKISCTVDTSYIYGVDLEQCSKVNYKSCTYYACWTKQTRCNSIVDELKLLWCISICDIKLLIDNNTILYTSVCNKLDIVDIFEHRTQAVTTIFLLLSSVVIATLWID